MPLQSAQMGAPPAALPALLSRRLMALGLHSGSIAGSEPATFLDLRTRCGACPWPERCAGDLQGAPADSTWQGYCPNAILLNALTEMWWLRLLL